MATELNTAKTIVDQPVVETPGEVIAEPSPATPVSEPVSTDVTTTGIDKANEEKALKERNAEFARQRRERERKEELERVKVQTIIDNISINPFTDEEIKDKDDVEEYLTMKQIEKSGGDPITDYAKHIKEQKRKNADTQIATSQKEEWMRNDANDFRAKHPDVDANALFQQEDFIMFSDGKLGSQPMAQIYQEYQTFLSKVKASVEKRTAQAIAAAKASPGAVASSNTGDKAFYTMDEIKKMSQSEVKANYDKVVASMKHNQK